MDSLIRSFYERLREAGKKPKVALVACMRKLLTILNPWFEAGSHGALRLFWLDKEDSRCPQVSDKFLGI
jgi:hypothetical protein